MKNKYDDSNSNSLTLRLQNIYRELSSVDIAVSDIVLLITNINNSMGLNVSTKEDLWRYPFNVKLI